MIEKIIEYWFLVPTVMAVASVVVNATPTESDNKYLAMVDKILNILAVNFNVKGEKYKR